MALFFTEEDVSRLLTMEDALSAVEEAFHELGMGRGVNRPRSRVKLPGIMLHVMPAGISEGRSLGLKAYTVGREGKARFLFLLFSSETGELLAVLEADRLGQMRTGAASGVATRYMSRPDSTTVGIYGTGWQARSQLRAVSAVRAVRRGVAYSRNEARRRAFCEEMTRLLSFPVRPVPSPEQVAREAEILITATTAAEPVLQGEWLRPGQHINAIGSNFAQKSEIDEAVVRRANAIAVDSKEQALLECGDLLGPVSAGVLSWEEVHELGDIVTDKVPGRSRPEDITLFESQGIAIEDVAVALRVYDRGRQQGVGMPLPF
ncbi:MAG: ornithine cyclodeaminase family protein [Acidobacteriota bacterium]